LREVAKWGKFFEPSPREKRWFPMFVAASSEIGKILLLILTRVGEPKIVEGLYPEVEEVEMGGKACVLDLAEFRDFINKLGGLMPGIIVETHKDFGVERFMILLPKPINQVRDVVNPYEEVKLGDLGFLSIFMDDDEESYSKVIAIATLLLNHPELRSKDAITILSKLSEKLEVEPLKQWRNYDYVVLVRKDGDFENLDEEDIFYGPSVEYMVRRPYAFVNEDAVVEKVKKLLSALRSGSMSWRDFYNMVQYV